MRRSQEGWNRLTKRTDQRVAEGKYQDLRDELKDRGGEPLLGVRKTLISVVIGSMANVSRFINANRVGLSRPVVPMAKPVVASASQPLVAPSYVVGKSPATPDDYQAFLLQAIESKQGLFQFVPRRLPWEVQAGPEGSDTAHGNPSVLGRLLHDMAHHAQANQPLCIDKYTVINVRRIDNDLTPVQGHTAEKNPNFSHQYQVDVQWTGDDGQACRASVPITQVGLRFTGNVLQEAELEIAQTVFTRHLANINDAVEPGICSPSGMGRSGTLMVHHEISQRIQEGLILDAASLDQQIEEVINKGREERGPYFVHSAAQFDVLRTALHKVLKNTQTPRADAKPSTDDLAPPESIEVVHAPENLTPLTVPPPVDQDLHDRKEVVRKAADVLGQAVIEMLQRYKNLNSDSENFRNELQPITLRVGKLLKLRQVMLEWEIPNPPSAEAMPKRFQTTKETLDNIFKYQDQLDRNNILSELDSNDDYTSGIRDITEAMDMACKEVFELEHLKNKFMRVENGSADNTYRLRNDEGNNCLLVSILQHATGQYDDREHHDMANVLREVLVGTSKNENGVAGINDIDGLYDDDEVLQPVVDIVNALYGRNLQLHIMTPGFADPQQSTVRPGVICHANSHATEPVLILKRPGHYEAVAPIMAIADKPLDPIIHSGAEAATNKVQEEIIKKIQSNSRIDNADFTKLNECLNKERDEAIDKIKNIQKEERESELGFNYLDDVFRHLKGDDIDDIFGFLSAYPKAVLREKIDIILNPFNDRVQSFCIQFNEKNNKVIDVNLINPIDYAAVDRKTNYKGMLI